MTDEAHRWSLIAGAENNIGQDQQDPQDLSRSPESEKIFGCYAATDGSFRRESWIFGFSARGKLNRVLKNGA
jgi:hypothetical protein